MHRSSKSRHVGRVVGVWRYPVKSMAAEALAQADVFWHGLSGDRRWAFLKPNTAHSGFPWLTLRDRGDLHGYRPRLADPSQPDRSAALVHTPSGATFDVTDPALAAELGPGLRVLKQDRGVFDTFPLSLITTQTLASLGGIAGVPLDIRRFRPNLLVEAAAEAPFPEDAWVGAVLRIGGARLRVDKRDGRCAVVTIDPVTAERNPQILRAIARDRQGFLGVYGSVVEPGRLEVGDPVWVDAGP